MTEDASGVVVVENVEKEQQFACDVCNVVIHGKNQWELHQTSKNHTKRVASKSEYDLDESDMFVDVTTEAYRAVMECKQMLIGADFIVYDRKSEENKCLICRIVIRDVASIVSHLKSLKHIHVFFKSHYPLVYEDIQKKSKNRGELQNEVSKQADLLVRKHGGKKEPRVHQKGYFQSLSEDGRGQVLSVLTNRRKELENLKKYRPGRSRSRSPRSRRRSPSRSHSPRHHSKRRSRSRSPRSTRRQRYDRKEREGRSSDPKRSPSASKSHPRRQEHREPEGRPVEGAVAPPPPVVPDIPVNVDLLDELPTDFDIFDKLCNARMVALEPGEHAYIQDLVENIQSSVIGLAYLAEYADSKGQYEPGYLCTLCQCRLNPGQAVKHAVSDKHSMEFLKKNYQKQYMALCIGTLGEEVRRQMKTRYLEEIESKEGGRRITQKIILAPDCRQVFRHHKRIAGFIGDPFKEAAFESEGGMSKPSLTYSDKVAKAHELADMERSLPPFCQRNLEEGWYSIRSKSVDYYRRLALSRNPDALWFSIRDPYGKENFYGDWNPQLMRRLQDKFNFKLDHVRWLQKLLSDWRVPFYTPLQMADLRPLEQEVEAAVLKELLDQTLKPVSTLRYMQVFQYEKYDEDTEQIEDRHERERSPTPMARDVAANTALSSELGAVRMGLKQQRKLQQNPEVTSKLAGPEESDEEKTKEDMDKKETEVQMKMRMLIDSVLRIAKQPSQHKNAILQLVTEFPNARDILFRLATRQPTQLQQLVTVAKNPTLTVPPVILEQLRKKLKEVEQEAALEKFEKEKKTRKEEEQRLAKEHEMRSKIEAARLELLKKQRFEENQRKAMETLGPKPVPVQVLTPKLPPAAISDPNFPGPPVSVVSSMESMVQAAMNRAVKEVVSQLGAGTGQPSLGQFGAPNPNIYGIQRQMVRGPFGPGPLFTGRGPPFYGRGPGPMF